MADCPFAHAWRDQPVEDKFLQATRVCANRGRKFKGYRFTGIAVESIYDKIGYHN
jgi:hypothetical protein